MADDVSPDPKPKRRDKYALPFSEDTETLDGRAWTRKPLLVLAVILVVIAAVVAVVLAGKDLTSGGDDGGSGDVPSVATTTTAPPRTTTSTTTSTTAPPPTTEATGPQPGEACSPEEGSTDCIDPEGDGNFTLITGGGACLETAADPLECADNDDDGDAGPAVIPT